MKGLPAKGLPANGFCYYVPVVLAVPVVLVPSVPVVPVVEVVEVAPGIWNDPGWPPKAPKPP